MSSGSSSSVAASWPVPNYINPETRGSAGKIVGIVLVSLVTIIIILRMYTRRFISKGFGLDDVLILLAFVPATAFAVIGVYGEVGLQWNRHIWDVDPRLYVPSLKFSLSELILFDLSTSTTKLSMLAMIHRVTSSSKNKRMNIAVLTAAVVISVNAFIFIVVSIFQCSPVSAYWTLSLKPKQCINEAAHLLAAGIINTITDFVVVFLPMQTVINLELPRKQRIIVVGLFGAGFLACAAGIVRIYFSWIMTTTTNHDTTWNSWAVWLASGIELYVGIICASIPAIKPFFATYLPQVIDASMRSRKSSRYSNDTKLSSPSNNFTGSHASFQTFIYGPSTPNLSLRQPQPVAQIQNESPLSNELLAVGLQRPTTVHRKSPSADLNKPLPTIQYTQKPSYPAMPPLRTDSSFSMEEEDTERLFSPQRNGRRFTDTLSIPAAAEDRTTVYIAYQGEDQGRGNVF
ncbi:hypothetical protein BKA67DRAFT_658915 [Truncatella angustata]|uniref:Rhodopsin domain-containing protein n=1 Tax=Truncatella angustata TaxID=152316 RepID=A0A9P8ZXA7_9PEZI|nr:uncharacterized protein BKA67DRAFT_658915 [Truncatella angustata]KAH6654632.1 hypothetical protein BKA67DRAFT_658915 [Truncatella angustata]